MSDAHFSMVVRPDGTIRCLYDEILDLPLLGSLQVARGSHVEPSADGQWFADLSPAQGPHLGPFRRRSDALKAERTWLEANWLVAPGAESPADGSVAD